MAFLLDTCLLSEVWKPAPNAGVIEWLEESAEDELYLSVLSLGEVSRGIERLPAGRKRERLAKDYVRLRSRFASRIVAVSDIVAERWGILSADASRAGRHLHVVDGLIAATALVFGFSVVTRNVGDFAATTVPIIDPWT